MVMKSIMEFDVQKRDQHKRLLWYVYLSDGCTLNEEIIEGRVYRPYDSTPIRKITSQVLERIQRGP
jgi:endonuclease YncB( thermonuclease family)